MRLLLLAILLGVSAPAHAWSEADTRRQVGYFVLHTIDWGMTLDISANCAPTRTRSWTQWEGERYYHDDPADVSETNPILSECPDRGEVNRYFLLTGLAHYGISRVLPPTYRKWWQRVTIGIEAGVVAHNASIGVNIRF